MKKHTHIGFFNSIFQVFECSCGATGRTINDKVVWREREE